MKHDEQTHVVNKAINMFRQYGYYENSLINKEKLIQIFDKQARKNHKDKFPHEIIDQIWGESQTVSKSQATVLTFCKILGEASEILQDRIHQIQGPTGLLSTKKAEIEKRQLELKDLETQYENGFEVDYSEINNLRKNITFLEIKMKEVVTSHEHFLQEYEQIQSSLKVNSILGEGKMEKTQIMNVESTLERYERVNSSHLKTIFQVTCVCLLFELLILTFKQSFFNIYYFLFLGYYNSNFVGYVLASLAASVIFDVVYLIFVVLNTFYLGNDRHTSSNVFFICTLVLVGICAALRIILIVKLFIYRVPLEQKQYFTIFDHEINLNRRGGKKNQSVEQDEKE